MKYLTHLKSKTAALAIMLGIGGIPLGAAHAQTLVPEAVTTTAISNVDPFKAGSTGNIDGLWANMDARRLSHIIKTASWDQTDNRIIIKRLLTASSTGPADPDAVTRLNNARLKSLYRLGAIEDLKSILRVVPTRDQDTIVEVATDVALLSGDFDKACDLAGRLVEGRDAPYWLKLRAFCDVWGQNEKASLMITLVQSQNLRDEGFLPVLQSVMNQSDYDGKLTVRYALDYAVAKMWGKWDQLNIQTRQPHVWAAIAQTKHAPMDLRLMAADKAASVMGPVATYLLYQDALASDETDIQHEHVLAIKALRDAVTAARAEQATPPDRLPTPTEASLKAANNIVSLAKTYDDFLILSGAIKQYATTLQADNISPRMALALDRRPSPDAPFFELMWALDQRDTVAAIQPFMKVQAAEKFQPQDLIIFMVLGLPVTDDGLERIKDIPKVSISDHDLLQLELSDNKMAVVLQAMQLADESKSIAIQYRMLKDLMAMGLEEQVRELAIRRLWTYLKP